MINAVITWIQARMVREDGQDLIEYALLGGLIALALIGIIAIFGDALVDMGDGIAACIDFSDTTTCSPGP